MLFATFIVAVFGYLLLTPTSVYAASAEWQDDQTIVYNDRTYQGPIIKTASHMLPDVPDGAVVFVDLDKNQTKGSVIFFKPSESDNYLNNSTSATFISYGKYTNGEDSLPEFSQPSAPQTISIAPRAPPANTQTTTSCDSDALQGIGWIVCPVTQSIARGMDYIYGAIAEFLKVPPLFTTNGAGQTMYRVWDFSRDLANVVFVIVMLLMIYGQVTGGFMTNYTIKKLLPRLIIAAVFVNLSFWICAICIDITNILGNSVQEMFINLRQSIVIEGETFKPISATELASFLLGGGALAAAGGIALFVGGTALTTAAVGGGAIYIFIPMLISLAFVVLVTFLILAARQAIITLLVILSPFALVAYVLPNTEKWFGRWRDTFFKLLFIYPAFSAIFGGAQLAAALIINTAQEANSFLLVLLAWGVQVAPLAITPLLLRLGGGVLNRFAGIVNNPAKGVFDRGKNWANENRDAAMARGQRRLAERNNTGTMRRFSAQGAAYGRQHRKQRREGEKAANEALTKGYFTQTAAGRDIHRLGERAKLEQGYGDNQNQAAWENEVRRDANLRARSIASHDAHSRAELYKQDVDSEANEHWQHTLRHDAALRTIKTASHLREGRAKLTEEYLNAQDERALQTQINVTPGLRDTKIQANVNTAHAELQKANVEAEGKMVFSDEVLNDRALRQMKIDTHELTKRAETADTIVQKNAEENWDYISRTDASLQQLRLREVQATDSAKFAQEQWNSLLENIVAKGAQAPNLAFGNAALANSIMGLRQDVQIEGEVQESAKMIQQKNMLSRYKTDEALRTYAGGVAGKQGANRVYAKAKAGYLNAMMDRIKESRSVIDEYTNAELQRLYFDGVDRYGNTDIDEEMRQAAMQEILLKKGNHWLVQKTRDWVTTTQGMIYDKKLDANGNVMTNANGDDVYTYYEPERNADGTLVIGADNRPVKAREIVDPDEVEMRRDREQLFMDAFKQTKHYVASMSGTDRGEYEQGTGILNMEDAILRDIRDDKWDGQRVVKTDNDEWQRLIQIVRDPGKRDAISPEARRKLVQHIRETQANRTMNGSIKGRERGLMNTVVAYLDESDGRSAVEKESSYWIDPATRVVVPPDTPNAEQVSITTVAPTIYRADRFTDSANGHGPAIGPNTLGLDPQNGIYNRDGSPRYPQHPELYP